jgi:hypothetical protein
MPFLLSDVVLLLCFAALSHWNGDLDSERA